MATTALQQIADTLRPRSRTADGVLPPLMVLLTIVTGIVDAVAYLKLGHVFVANMTGNVVFLGFSAVGASGLSAVGSLVAIACFLPGGVVAGRLAARVGGRRSISCEQRPPYSSCCAPARYQSPLQPETISAQRADTG